MGRWLLRSLLLLAALALSACGVTAQQSGQANRRDNGSEPVSTTEQATPSASPEAARRGTAAATTPASTATSAAARAPATAMMAELKLAGEPHAAQGDPAAPITVVEFSDFG